MVVPRAPGWPLGHRFPGDWADRLPSRAFLCIVMRGCRRLHPLPQTAASRRPRTGGSSGMC